MASKGQKFLKYTEYQKKKIICMYKEGYSSTQIASKFSIPASTVRTLATKLRKTGSLKNDIYHKRGKTSEKKLTIEDYKERYEILKKYRAFLKAQRERK